MQTYTTGGDLTPPVFWWQEFENKKRIAFWQQNCYTLKSMNWWRVCTLKG
ncbi:hypothetical protein ARMA_1693 [Ardenticatena maritima]|uniref:Uncharacterized protein n=1 Tax=Ardenticatena maritima TaxID=872965 RepID=A0A0M9UCV4_9CHLR|nr:hypothetical protein ARMA_1693 [Ardenticatena maritima]